MVILFEWTLDTSIRILALAAEVIQDVQQEDMGISARKQ